MLPQAVGDVFLSQENRPDGMDYYDMVVADIHGIRPSELIEHQKKGGKVFGTFCVYVPDEVIFAADAIATGLCGGSQFWVPGGEKVLPNNKMCIRDSCRAGQRITEYIFECDDLSGQDDVSGGKLQ